MTEQDVLKALKNVMDPELGKNIVDLKMVRNIRIDGNKVAFDFYLTTPACPLKDVMRKDAEQALAGLGVKEVEIEFKSDLKSHGKASEQSFINPDAFQSIKNIIPVYSAKGGVGKSTVAVNLAASLSESGAKVGLLDMDVYGPSVPRMLAVDESPTQFGNKLIPIKRYGISLMSIGLLIGGKENPVIWRAPLVNNFVREVFEAVEWEELDYLVVDLPPGTGDVQITFAQNVPIAGTVFVTTPQSVALDDTIKGIHMFRKMHIPVLGVVRNMSYFECAHCGKKTHIFPDADFDKMVKEWNVPLLGELPIDPQIAQSAEDGKPVVLEFPDSVTAKAFEGLSCAIAASVSTFYKK